LKFSGLAISGSLKPGPPAPVGSVIGGVAGVAWDGRSMRVGASAAVSAEPATPGAVGGVGGVSASVFDEVCWAKTSPVADKTISSNSGTNRAALLADLA